MPTVNLNGVDIAYDDLAPAGPARHAVLLIHGFASNRREGWRRTGWYAALERRGARTIALDLRGHGESKRSHDPSDYAPDALAADALALLDRLEVGRADVFGYSRGARTALDLALAAPDRVGKLILGGVGDTLFSPPPDGAAEAMAQALSTDDVAAIHDPLLRSFRQFADEQGEDRRALAAFHAARPPTVERGAVAALPMPVLAVAGERDEIAGDPEALAAAFRHGRGVRLGGCDHFSAIPHAGLKASVFDFLDGLLDDDFPPFE